MSGGATRDRITVAEASSAVREEGGGAPGAKVRLEAWSWPAAFLAVFLVLVFAWGIGFPIRRLVAGRSTWITWFAVISGSLAAGSFLLLSARRAMEFFLSVRVGIAVIVFFILGSILSVLVHPRDPDKYIGGHPPLSFERQERLHKDDFAWATGYFLYHLMHPYGYKLPKAEVPEGAKATLDRISQEYGRRASAQESSGMRTALAGQLRGSEIKEYISENQGFFDGLYEVCTFLQMNGTPTGKGAWTSDWFTALMGLLFLMVLTNTFRRGFGRAIAQGSPGFGFVAKLPSALGWDVKSLVSIARIGFLVTHLGVMTALVGGFLSKLTEDRGVAQLTLDPLRERFPPQGSDRPLKRETYEFRTYSGLWRAFDPLFAVRLANFRADYRDNLDIEFLDGAERPKTLPRYRFHEIWLGRRIPLEFDANGEGDPKTIVRVLDHWPRAEVRMNLAERAAGTPPANVLEAAGPALKVGFKVTDGTRSDGGGAFLFARDPEYSLFEEIPGLRIQLEAAASADEQDLRLKVPFDGERFGTMGVIVGPDAKAPAAMVPIAVGSDFEFDTPRGKVKGRILNALPDARLLATPEGGFQAAYANIPREDVAPLHPGVQIAIQDPTERSPWKDWFYESPRDFVGGKDGVVKIANEDVRFLIVWDHWRSPARERYRIVVAPGLPAKIAKVGSGPAQEMPVGRAVKLDGGVELAIEERADLPKLVPTITPMPGDPDDEAVFFDRDHVPACRIEVAGPAGTQEFTLAATPLADVAVYANRIRLRMFENTFELPREWKSKLEFLEPDAAGKSWDVKRTQTIRVNDYAYYRGYRFFQTDASAQLPGYSGVGVVYDPGIETVLVGMYMVVFGVAYVFLVKPLLLRKASP